MFDTSELPPTSAKGALKWRDTSLTLIWLREDGPIVSGYTIADKLEVVEHAGRGDRILAVRQKQFPTRQEVMVVDDVDSARRVLRGGT